MCILDPDAAVRDSLVYLLERQSCPVKAFDDAGSFLDELDLGMEPACLVLDWGLPQPGCPALLAELARRGCKFPFIATANQSDIPTAVAAMRSGAMDFIEKPFVSRLLVDRIRSLLHKPASRP
ncbi:MAG: response regulator [Gammaproteobacteria bacterium]|nr:response regulator [Gammaproteobacteria bacterium]